MWERERDRKTEKERKREGVINREKRGNGKERSKLEGKEKEREKERSRRVREEEEDEEGATVREYKKRSRVNLFGSQAVSRFSSRPSLNLYHVLWKLLKCQRGGGTTGLSTQPAFKRTAYN